MLKQADRCSGIKLISGPPAAPPQVTQTVSNRTGRGTSDGVTKTKGRSTRGGDASAARLFLTTRLTGRRSGGSQVVNPGDLRGQNNNTWITDQSPSEQKPNRRPLSNLEILLWKMASGGAALLSRLLIMQLRHRDAQNILLQLLFIKSRCPELKKLN